MKAQDSPTLKIASNFNDYAKNVEAFNSSLNNTLLNIYKKLNELDNTIKSMKKLSDKDIDSIANDVYTQVLNKVTNAQINKEEVINTIKAQYDQKVNDLYNYVSKSGQTINALVERVNQISESLSKSTDLMNTNTSELSRRITEIQEDIQKLKDDSAKQFSGLNDEVQKKYDEVQGKLNEFEGKLNKLSDDLYKGMPQINDLVQRTTNIEQKLSVIDSTTQRLTSVLNSDTLDISAFKTRVDTMASQMNALNDVINKSMQDILEVVKDTSPLIAILSKINPDAMQTSIKTLENGLNALQQQVNKFVDTISALQKDVAELKSRVSINTTKA
ncbi:MAG: hypothetical protein QXP36_11135 [Conexivisphaerales archaeon]